MALGFISLSSSWCWLIVLAVHLEQSCRAAKIAIVGAGIGGSSSAHFLREELGKDVELTIYEREEVGGRMKKVEISGQKFEAGATFLHSRNEYMKNFTSLVGLEGIPVKDVESLGIFTGQHFHFFITNAWLSDMAAMVARYGLNLIKISRMASQLMEKFVNIYNVQARGGPPAKDLHQLLQSMSGDETFQQLMETRAHAYLVNEVGLSERVVEEFVSAMVRVIYNQDLDSVSAFVVVASLVSGQTGLWHVRGGNYKVCKGLIRRAHARLIMDAVQSIERLGSSPAHKYRMITYGGKTAEYDAVIVAAPLQLANISFTGFQTALQLLASGHYQHTVVTLVKGWPRRAAVLLNPITSNGVFPDGVLTVTNDSLPFVSLQRCMDSLDGHVTRGAPVWKIQSRRRLTKAVLDYLFLQREEVVVKEFYAYPKFSSFSELTSVPFVLDDGVFYTSSVEWATSAMEMSAIAGRNAALLVKEFLRN